MKNSSWSEKIWILSLIYFFLGFVNILFAWVGLLCFFIPIIISVFGGGKAFCNSYCGRGQFFRLMEGRFCFSRNRDIPSFLLSRWFRYGFLVFFTVMFLNMLFATWAVFSGSGNLNETLRLFWTFDVPWHWANKAGNSVPSWALQFAFGFYSLMVTSFLLGIGTMFLYKPRSWCVYCPMGTATQMICKIRNGEKL